MNSFGGENNVAEIYCLNSVQINWAARSLSSPALNPLVISFLGIVLPVIFSSSSVCLYRIILGRDPFSASA